MEAKVREVVEQLRSGLGEETFFALIELKGDVLPAIAAVFRSEPHPDIRALLIKAAWERREDAVLPLLAEALNDDAEEVWQEALDGLVAFAGEHALEILVQARVREFTDGPSAKRFRLWLEEAIQQVNFELRAKT